MSQNNASRRTLQAVHRDSKLAGTVEAALWKSTDIAERDRALEAARLYEVKHKQKGRRNGPLGGIGLEIHRALWSVVDFSTGRLEPSIAWLMRVTGRCRDAIVTGLKRLKRCGFVRWVRRLEYTGERGVRGPQVHQVTNAYALDTPADAAELLSAPAPRTVARAATPADYRRAIEAAALPSRVDHFRDAAVYLSKTPSRALERLNLLLAECESATPDQSRFQNLLRDAPKGAGRA